MEQKEIKDRLKNAIYSNIKRIPNSAEMVYSGNDSVGIREGELKIEMEKEVLEGKVVTLLHQDKNLVVTQAETLMAQMSLGLRTMSYLELGDPLTPTTPVLADTNLQQTTGQKKAITGVVNGNNGIYTTTFTTGEANGFTLTEAGLFTTPFGAGLMFARKIFPGIVKTAAFSLKFTWTIVYQVPVSTGSGCSGISLLGVSQITTDYLFVAIGGETTVTIPIDFPIGGKSLDVFLNGQRLSYNDQYFETTIGLGKGIQFIAFSLLAGDKVYIVFRRAA